MRIITIEEINVAAVFTNGQVRIYGPAQRGGIRRFVDSKQFSSYGKALQFAHEFEQKQLK